MAHRSSWTSPLLGRSQNTLHPGDASSGGGSPTHSICSNLSLPLYDEHRTSSRGSTASQWSNDTTMSYLSVPDEYYPPLIDLNQILSSTPHLSALLLAKASRKGLVRGRDGGRNGAGYMNLPSPNVQSEDGEHEIFKKNPNHHPKSSLRRISDDVDHCSDSEYGDEPGPPASALNRRKALVPPKVFTDSAPFDESEQDSPKAVNGSGSLDGSTPRNKRRSSIVVIPPMQICPGDLLVYSKVLTQKSNVIGKAGDLEGSTQSLAVTDTDPTSRKGRNKWSLLQLFDRSNRTKSESLTGLEEVLSGLQPSEFEDEQLSRYKGMCWADFVTFRDAWVSNKEARASRELAEKAALNGETKDELKDGLTSESAIDTKPRTPTPSFLSKLESCAENDSVKSKSHFWDNEPHTSKQYTSTCFVNDKTSLLESERKELSPPERKVPEKVDPPPPPKKRRPLMRAKTELTLGKNRAGQIFSIFSEKVLAPDRSPVKTTPPILEDVISPLDDTSPIPSPAILPSEPVLDGVGRTLEEAFDNVQAALVRNDTKRREAVWDLFQSECAFLYDHLMVLKNVYMEPLKKIQVDGYAMFAEPELLFGNLDELCCVTYAFCKEFINLLEQHHAPGGNLDTTQVLVKLFQKGSKATMLCQAYHRYALNYINALNYLETLRRQLEFNEFEKWCNKDSRCKKLQLTDLLVAPVQHIMKVPLILRDIETRTEDPQEREAVREIIEAEEHSLRELDDKMKWLKNFERLLEIQRNIFWPPITELDPKIYIPEFLKNAISRQPCERLIVSPRRQIIMEGILHLVDHNKPQEMFVILFDDMLLITRRKKGLHKKKSSLTENWASSCSRSQSNESSMRYIVYKQPLSLDRFFLHDVTPQEMSTHKLEAAFVIVNLNRFQQIVAIYTFQAQSEQLKHTWLLRLRDTQEKWKQTLQNTVFRNQHRLSVPASSPPKPHPLDPRNFV